MARKSRRFIFGRRGKVTFPGIWGGTWNRLSVTIATPLHTHATEQFLFFVALTKHTTDIYPSGVAS